MEIWFVHRGFPGQYMHLVPLFSKRTNCRVVTIGCGVQWKVEGAQQYAYKEPERTSLRTHDITRVLETPVRYSVKSVQLALRLKNRGHRPDIICSHCGLGDTLFYRDIFPDAKFLTYQEFFHCNQGFPVDFDLEFRPEDKLTGMRKRRLANAIGLLSLDITDWNVSPTHWQWSQFPKEYQPKISVIHDGIDTNLAKPDPSATVSLDSKLPLANSLAIGKAGKSIPFRKRRALTLSREDEVITYVARGLEPHRGFHIFMRALPELLHRRPKAHVVIVGSDRVSYGFQLPQGETYREKLLEEVRERIDINRVHFLGWVAYEKFLSALQISSVHVYLTYPFVLSWSMLKAMSVGCALVASKTQPVEEVIEDGVNGLLFDFFSPEALCEAVCRVLDDPDLAHTLRQNARKTILEHYDLESVCLPRQVELIEKVANGELPPPEPV